MTILVGPNDNPVLLCHPPRTGGRYVSWVMRYSGYRFLSEYPEYAHYDDMNTIEYTQVLHFTYEQYQRHFDADNIAQQLCVVRNPMDRFLSSYIFLYDKLEIIGVPWEYLESYDTFKTCLDFQAICETQNVFVPQSRFVGKNTSIWKFEDGFNDKWFEWMASLDHKVSKPVYDYPKRAYDFLKGHNLTPAMIENVKRYYQEDYERFGYT